MIRLRATTAPRNGSDCPGASNPDRAAAIASDALPIAALRT